MYRTERGKGRERQQSEIDGFQLHEASGKEPQMGLHGHTGRSQVYRVDEGITPGEAARLPSLAPCPSRKRMEPS
jgi:hypothetical protein